MALITRSGVIWPRPHNIVQCFQSLQIKRDSNTFRVLDREMKSTRLPETFSDFQRLSETFETFSDFQRLLETFETFSVF